ncbi:MAG: M23 family metallopeptidase, partial [Proteobacteria bacterium]|nr:M23 family metallopeptidase [Pseudomonadota bacterium]
APPPRSVAAPVIAAPPPVVAPAPAPGLSTAPANAALAGRGLFTWPLRGDLISGFGPKGVNQRSDGVNISAAEGDPVRAAAAGTVVYAGDQVKGGFGKLVLIEHENRWFTAYAHLADITVRMRDRIAQNQQIGRAGRTGNVGAPQLYFEVRHAPAAGERARPVDPLPLLPQ